MWYFSFFSTRGSLKHDRGETVSLFGRFSSVGYLDLSFFTLLVRRLSCSDFLFVFWLFLFGFFFIAP